MTRSPSDGRFAPSPTGTLHVGNLRTALLAWLFARSAGGAFRMRVEDLDPGRSRPETATEQLDDMVALGIDWDGEVLWQSRREDAYARALAVLKDAGLVYECFCTRADIRAAASAAHGPVDRYPGICRDRSAADRKALREERKPALRVRAGNVAVEFEDRLHGRVSGVVDDFVVRRNDGAYAYNLAVVVDDDFQGVGEVVRAHDLLDSTPRQIWLSEALGLPAPSYAHVPLVLAGDGSRLAKRHGSVTLRELGPEEAMAWICRSLGWAAASSARELLGVFDPATLPREPSVWEPDPPGATA